MTAVVPRPPQFAKQLTLEQVKDALSPDEQGHISPGRLAFALGVGRGANEAAVQDVPRCPQSRQPSSVYRLRRQTLDCDHVP